MTKAQYHLEVQGHEAHAPVHAVEVCVVARV